MLAWGRFGKSNRTRLALSAYSLSLSSLLFSHRPPILRFWQRFYIGLTSVFGILACYVTFSYVNLPSGPRPIQTRSTDSNQSQSPPPPLSLTSSVFEGHGKKGFRVLVFICLAATSVVPSLHYGQMCGFDKLGRVVDTFWWVPFQVA